MPIKVAFFPPADAQWMGGVNYYANLFQVIAEHGQGEFCCVAILPKGCDAGIAAKYASHAHIAYESFLDRKSLPWILARLGKRLGVSFYAHRMRRLGVQVVSHASHWENYGMPLLGWIPDFQHMHLPTYFDADDLRERNLYFKELVDNATGILLSSRTALTDCERFAGYSSERFHLLHFVASNIPKVPVTDVVAKTMKKYSIPERYFHIPNQMWAHKNHKVVFEAVQRLKNEGLDICVVCTGLAEDSRNPGHVQVLRDFIAENGLESNIRMLGLVSYEEMVSLLMHSIAVINPSLFEGWSTTVEECKALSHPIVLSALPVHIEQNPPCRRFFDPGDSAGLATVLREVWCFNKWEIVPAAEPFGAADYYRQYRDIVQSVLGK